MWGKEGSGGDVLYVGVCMTYREGYVEELMEELEAVKQERDRHLATTLELQNELAKCQKERDTLRGGGNPDLDQLEAICAAATPGPWQDGTAGRCNLIYFDGDDIHGVALVESRYDGDFIAAARTALPELIARVRELERLGDIVNRAYKIIEAERDRYSTELRELEASYWQRIGERDTLRSELEVCAQRQQEMLRSRDALRAEVEQVRKAKMENTIGMYEAKLAHAVEALRKIHTGNMGSAYSDEVAGEALRELEGGE